MEKIKSFINTIDAINDWTGKIFSWLIIPIIAIVVYEVVLRKVFNAPTIWAFELTTILYGVHFMLGAPHTLLHKGHVSVDLIYSRFSPKVQAYIDVVTYILFFFLFNIVLLWMGTKFAWTSIEMLEKSQSPWRPPLYPIKAIIPVTFFLLILQGISKFIRDLTFIIKEDGI